MYNLKIRNTKIGVSRLGRQTNKRIKIKVGEQIFESILKASNHFGVTPTTLRNYLRKKTEFRGMAVIAVKD